LNERCNALRMLGVGKSFEEAISSAQNGESDFRAMDEGSESLAMAFAGFAEKDGLDGAAGAESFLDQADTFNANGAGSGGKTAAKSHAKFLEPAIVAAGE
jgi:hypothetical protein